MEISDLVEILHGNIAHISRVNANDVALYDMEVIVYPKDVKNMLQSYLDGKVSSNDLTNWANFICIRGEYCPPNYLDDGMEDDDYYEDMFYVIQRLSTPKFDGAVNEKRVKLYLSELDKYSDAPA